MNNRPYAHRTPQRKPRTLNRKPLHPQRVGQYPPTQGIDCDHTVVWRPLPPVCGPPRGLLERFRTLLLMIKLDVQCCMLGALASVAGGARNQAGCAWLTLRGRMEIRRCLWLLNTLRSRRSDRFWRRRRTSTPGTRQQGGGCWE